MQVFVGLDVDAAVSLGHGGALSAGLAQAGDNLCHTAVDAWQYSRIGAGEFVAISVQYGT